MKDAILLDLFSGLGGFHLGLEQAGFTFKKVYFSEIDKHAIANYKRNFPDAEYIGSVTDIRGSTIERPNIITFGSPCQDFSLAGKRKGMDGDRSSLVTEAIRLITETRPDVFIWENVKGTFSSNDGEDFWAIIQAFADIGVIDLNGNCLIRHGFYPKIESEYTWSELLQPPDQVAETYFLSKNQSKFATDETRLKKKYTQILIQSPKQPGNIPTGEAHL